MPPAEEPRRGNGGSAAGGRGTWRHALHAHCWCQGGVYSPVCSSEASSCNIALLSAGQELASHCPVMSPVICCRSGSRAWSRLGTRFGSTLCTLPARCCRSLLRGSSARKMSAYRARLASGFPRRARSGSALQSCVTQLLAVVTLKWQVRTGTAQGLCHPAADATVKRRICTGTDGSSLATSEHRQRLMWPHACGAAQPGSRSWRSRRRQLWEW